MRKILLAVSVLAGLAGGIAAIPANAAPLAHGMLSSSKALLPVVNTATNAVPNEDASVQMVQYYRHYDRHFYYGHHSYYGRHPYYGRHFYSRY